MPDGVSVSGSTFRLIPSQFPPINAFDDVSSPEDLEAVMELEGWTNDRLVESRLRRLPQSEWVFGRPNASVIMASFLHSAPGGNRFTGSDLNAWYASFSEKTAIVEVAHHLRRQMIYEGKSDYRMKYRSYDARLDGNEYVDIRGEQSSRPELYDSFSYIHSQKFGEAQRAAGLDGIIYDSLRHIGGINAVCFVPTKVLDVVQRAHFEIQVFVDPKYRPIIRRLSTS